MRQIKKIGGSTKYTKLNNYVKVKFRAYYNVVRKQKEKKANI